MTATDCEVCIAKKRKCGRETPKCQHCGLTGENCQYARRGGNSATASANRNKALENRLKKLESIVQALQLDEMGSEDGMSSPSPTLRQAVPSSSTTTHAAVSSPSYHSKSSQLLSAITTSNLKSPSLSGASNNTSSSSFPPHVDAQRPDLEELYSSTGQSYVLLKEEDSRKAIQESYFLRFVCYTLASTVAPPDLVPPEFGSREAMAEAYFKRAESFLRRVLRKPSYHSVLGLFGLILYCTRTQRAPEAFYYYSVGIRIALSLGLNNEATYRDAGLSEQVKETMRATWWTIYMGDRLFAALRFEAPVIKDRDCLVRLPVNPAVVAHPQDHMETLEIAIMSSSSLHIPTPANLSLTSYLLILIKIKSHIISFSQESQNNAAKQTSEDAIYKESVLLASLDGWLQAVPDSVRNVVAEISRDEPPADPKVVWKNAFMMILYYCVKLYIPKRRLVRNIEQNAGWAASSAAAGEVFMASKNLCAILHGFLKHNPSFLYVPQFVAPCLFGAGLMVLLISRLQLNAADASTAELSFKTIVACINQHALLFNIGTAQKLLLDQLATCKDPLLLCIAIKSLKNIQGESKTSISSDILVANDGLEEEEQDLDVARFNTPLQSAQQLHMYSQPHLQPALLVPDHHDSASFTSPVLLQNVASMQSPFGNMMLCGGTEGMDDFQSFFASI